LQPDPENAELYRDGYHAYRALYRPAAGVR
jgi:hypothetical protein